MRRWGLWGALVATGCASTFGLVPLESVPADGPPTLTTLADEAATELLIDGGQLFWTTSTAVRTCSLDSCQPTTLASGVADPHALSVTGLEVRYASVDKVYRLARVSPDPATILIDADGNTTPITDFVQIVEYMYYTPNSITRCDYAPASKCAFDSSLDPGTDRVSRLLSVDDSGRWWGTGTMSAVFVATANNADIDFPLSTDSVPQALLATPLTMFARLGSGTVVSWPSNATAATAATTVPVADTVAIGASGTALWIATRQSELWRLGLGGTPGEPARFLTAPATIIALAISANTGVLALPDRIVAFTPPP